MAVNLLAILATAVMIVGVGVAVASTNIGAGLTTGLLETRKLTGQYWHHVESRPILGHRTETPAPRQPDQGWRADLLPPLQAWRQPIAWSAPSVPSASPAPVASVRSELPAAPSMHMDTFQPIGFQVAALLQAQARLRSLETAAAQATTPGGATATPPRWRHVPKNLKRAPVAPSTTASPPRRSLPS